MERLAVLKKTILASPPWSPRRLAREGERVYAQPASNLPSDARIKWWLRPEDENAEWNVDAVDGYGVGAWEGDIEFLEDE